LEGIIIFFVIVSVITSIANAAKKAQQNGGDQRGVSSSGANGASRQGAYTGSVTSDQRARLEQLRRMQQQRQQEQRQSANAPSAKPAAFAAEKPVYPHDTEDCGGGSIHDGYHEGGVRRPAPASSAEGSVGRQGVLEREGRGASDLYKKDRSERKTASAADIPAAKQPVPASTDAVSAPIDPEPSGAEKLSKAISDKPAIVQGLIWSEVLGRPLSDSRQ